MKNIKFNNNLIEYIKLIKYNIKYKRTINKNFLYNINNNNKEHNNRDKIFDDNIFNCYIDETDKIIDKTNFKNEYTNLKHTFNCSNDKDKIKNNSNSLDYNELKGSFNLSPKAILNEEISEEEFTSVNSFKSLKTNNQNINNNNNSLNNREIRFIRPPHTKKEIDETLNEVDNIYKKSKSFLFNTNLIYQTEKKNSNLINSIPYGMTFNKLSLLNLKTNNLKCQINLVGVKEESDFHADYLYKLLEISKPDSILITTPPDNSLFINTLSVANQVKKDRSKINNFYQESIANNNYLHCWKYFINNPSHKTSFYVNPKPSNLDEITFSPEGLKQFMTNNIFQLNNTSNFQKSNSLFKISSNIIYSRSSKTLENKIYNIEKNINSNDFNIDFDLKYFGNPYLTAMLYSYNSLSQYKYSNIILCDIPKIEEIKYIFNEYFVNDLQDEFKTMIENINNENYDFNSMYNLSLRKGGFLNLTENPEKYHKQLNNYNIPFSNNIFNKIKKTKYNYTNVKYKYIVEIIKQASLGKENIVVVADFRLIDSIIDAWKNLQVFEDNSKTNDFSIYLEDLNNFYLHQLENLEGTEIDSFNFFEKAVIIDILCDNYISNQYVKHGVFPINYDEIIYRSHKNNRTNKNVLNDNFKMSVINFIKPWEYYYDHYIKKYNENIIVVPKIYKKYLLRYNTSLNKTITYKIFDN